MPLRDARGEREPEPGPARLAGDAGLEDAGAVNVPAAREGGLLRVFCTIYVETESQKPIVIGRAGSMIKTIGTEARQDIARFFNCKVYLDLRVKVKPDWRDDEKVLDSLGLPRKR